MSNPVNRLVAKLDSIDQTLLEIRSEMGLRTSEVEVKDLARRFAVLDDDAQAKFFCEVARIASNWTTGLGPDLQWWQIGGHLATCEWSTEEGRDMLRTIVQGIEAKEPTS